MPPKPPRHDTLIYNGTELIWYDRNGNEIARFAATSVAEGKQNSAYQRVKGSGPLPEGEYKIDLISDPNKIVELNSAMETLPADGIQKLPTTNNNGERIDTSDWGTMRARLNEQPGTNTYGRNSFYIHNSNKGYSHGCIEIGKGFFPKLLTYAKYYGSIDLTVKYPTSNSPTLGNTRK